MNKNDVASTVAAKLPGQVDCFTQSLSHRGQCFVLNGDWEFENFRLRQVGTVIVQLKGQMSERIVGCCRGTKTETRRFQGLRQPKWVGELSRAEGQDFSLTQKVFQQKLADAQFSQNA